MDWLIDCRMDCNKLFVINYEHILSQPLDYSEPLSHFLELSSENKQVGDVLYSVNYIQCISYIQLAGGLDRWIDGYGSHVAVIYLISCYSFSYHITGLFCVLQ